MKWRAILGGAVRRSELPGMDPNVLIEANAALNVKHKDDAEAAEKERKKNERKHRRR